MSDEAKWSPEPWRAGAKGYGAYLYDGEGRLLVGEDDYGEVLDPDDVRRLVACVNACAGIPTAALEAGALAKALDSLAEVVARRERACEDNPWSRFEGSDGRYGRADAALRSLGRLGSEERAPVTRSDWKCCAGTEKCPGNQASLRKDWICGFCGRQTQPPQTWRDRGEARKAPTYEPGPSKEREGKP